jgi:hypothetical protein
MKKSFLLLLFCSILEILAFNAPKKGLIGLWKITYRSGHAEADFRSDGSFKAVDDKGGFDINGKYKFKGDVLYISDSTCGTGYWGKYKPSFVNEDSISSVVIEDSCVGRKIVCDGATLVRKKVK